MKFKLHPYTHQTIEVRVMTMGDLKLTIAQGLLKNQLTDIEIRIVDCFMGEVDVYKNLDQLLLEDTNTEWRVSVYQMQVMKNNVTDTNYLKVIMSDNVEMMD